MTKQYCSTCSAETWHNPVKDKSAPPRCTQCGHPKRYGQKNYGLRVGGKIIMEPKPWG